MLSPTRRSTLELEVSTLETQWGQLRETLKQCKLDSHDTLLFQSERMKAFESIGTVELNMIRLERRIDDVRWLLTR